MIPIAFLQAWSVKAPWPDLRQVEQDLIISRALLQRRASRDLFDLHQGLKQLTLVPEKVIACFNHYLALEGKPITRAIAEQRMLEKLTRSLTEDIAPLLPAGIYFREADAILAFERVWIALIARIGGDGWKLTQSVLEELRVKRFPELLTSRHPSRRV